MAAYDVIVIGLGAMGSAAAFHCARRGLRVLGLEQFEIAHDMGSSHGYSRMIRMAYYEHPDYVPLLRRAYELWDELEAVSGRKLLHRTGGVYMGPAGGEVVSGTLRAAREHGLAYEAFDGAEIARRYPMFRVPGNYVGVYEPAAGFLVPERCIVAHAEQALRAGVDLRAHEPVMGWEAGERSVTVRTARGTYEAATVIFCGGAWTGKLLAELRVPLVVTRQVLGWMWPVREPDRFALGRFGVWGIEQEDGSLAYGFPLHEEAPGLKVARHGRGAVTDAEGISRQITEADEAEVRGIVERYLPTAVGPTLAMRTCMYTNSPDGHSVIDRLPGLRNVVMACGFSGHGFKFASVMGEVLAEMVSGEGRSRWPVEFLSLARFIAR